MKAEKKGKIKKDEVWSGTIYVTGDVVVEEGATLTIEPGTRVLFANDRNDYPPPKKEGDRTPSRSIEEVIRTGEGIDDTFMHFDPLRTLEYAKYHSALIVLGSLSAVGESDRPIVFTSASLAPKYGDWKAINFGPKSKGRMDYCIVEWCRSGVFPQTDDLKVTNSVFRHILYGAIHAHDCSPVYEYNIIHDDGHEAFDCGSSHPTIRYNIISQVRSGCVFYGDSKTPLTFEYNVIKDCCCSIQVMNKGNAVIRNNILIASGDVVRPWTYRDYVLFPRNLRWPITPQGIKVADFSQAEILNNVFTGFRGPAISYSTIGETEGIFFPPTRPTRGEVLEEASEPQKMIIKNNIFNRSGAIGFRKDFGGEEVRVLGGLNLENVEISYNLYNDIVMCPHYVLGKGEMVDKDPRLDTDFHLKPGSPAKKAGQGGVDMGVIWNSEFEKTMEKYFQLYPYNPEFEEALKKMRDLRRTGTYEPTNW